MEAGMEPNTPLDVELEQRAVIRRAAALELIAKTKPLSVVTGQIPIWFALVVLALVAALSYKTHLNPAPYIAFVLIPAILWISGCLIRMQRRMEALVQLVAPDTRS
jgi:hypothetical protein